MSDFTSRKLHWACILPLALSIFSLASASALPSLPRATTLQEPTNDPFFDIPRNIGNYAAGQIIRHRPVTTFITNTTSIQVFYRTNDHFGQPDGTVATIWIPEKPVHPPKIFSYQFAEDADSIDCAPSWAWIAPDRSNNSAIAMGEGPVVVPFGLSQGAYVVNPNAEGSKSSWLVGKTEAHATLDGIRATINFFSLPSEKTKVGMYGYSGAAHTTVWAASEHERYAPELNLVGAAYGGTLVDLRSTYNLLNGESGALLSGGALYGLANGYPKLNEFLTAHENMHGKQFAKLVRSKNYCLVAHEPDFDGFNFDTLFTSDVLAPNTELSRVFNIESLLANVSSISVPIPKFPRYEYHGTADETVPYQPEVEYIEQQCENGASIAFTPYPGLNHTQTSVTGLKGALTFIGEALAGSPPEIICGQPL